MRPSWLWLSHLALSTPPQAAPTISPGPAHEIARPRSSHLVPPLIPGSTPHTWPCPHRTPLAVYVFHKGPPHCVQAPGEGDFSSSVSRPRSSEPSPSLLVQQQQRLLPPSSCDC
uniref:Secreted protein n=1 Tax=Knipowitschia caucasica TaxID=637954 RepID=A0AAV2KHR4_KNICA